jgi:predicted transcriptional regulator
MTIVISLSLEVEARLREQAAQRGQDVNVVAAELVAVALGVKEDLQEAIEGIQRGLDDFETGRTVSFF